MPKRRVEKKGDNTFVGKKRGGMRSLLGVREGEESLRRGLRGAQNKKSAKGEGNYEEDLSNGGKKRGKKMSLQTTHRLRRDSQHRKR